MDVKSGSARKIIIWSVVAIAAAVVIGVGVVAVVLMVGPGIIEQQVQQAFEEKWEGSVSIASVEPSVSGPLGVYGVRLVDNAGRTWVRVGSASIELAGLAGGEPQVKSVTMRDVELTLHIVDGRCRLPVRQTTTDKAKGVSVSVLERLAIGNASVMFAFEDQSGTRFSDLDVRANREDALWKVSVEQGSAMVLKGTIDAVSMLADLKFQIDRQLGVSETSAVLALAKQDRIREAQGKLAGGMTLRGRVDQVSTWQVDGAFDFSGWTVKTSGGVAASEIAGRATIDNKRIGIDTLSAKVCKGLLAGQLNCDLEGRYVSGRLSLEQVDLAQASGIVGAETKITTGTASADLQFATPLDDINALSVQGRIMLNDADVWPLPVIPTLMRNLRPGQDAAKNLADADFAVSIVGKKVTIVDGRLSNRFDAIMVEPGATIDLDTHHIDAYVVTIPVKQAHDLFSKLKVVNVLVKARDKLSRLRIKGKVSDPPAKLVRRTSLAEVGQDTVRFFREIGSSGGQIKLDMRRKLGDLFKPLTSRPSSTAPSR